MVFSIIRELCCYQYNFRTLSSPQKESRTHKAVNISSQYPSWWQTLICFLSL